MCRSRWATTSSCARISKGRTESERQRGHGLVVGAAERRARIAPSPPPSVSGTGGKVMASPKEMDAEQLRRAVRLGGLEIPHERAIKLLALANALMKGCARLETLEFSAKGGRGARPPW